MITKFKTKIKIAVSLLIVIILFALVSILVKQNIDFFESLVKNHFILGIFIFTLFEIISIVAAPITSLPILPIASNTYGILLTSIFFSVGGIIGSIIAFFIGRRFRDKILGKLVSLEDVNTIEKAIPKRHYFLTLIIMRFFIPADVLSYTLGIATSIDYGLFMLTTIIGVIPSAFFFAYLGVLPWFYQIIGWLFGIIILVIFLYFLFKKR